ncbi:peptidoglycan-binding domain-containing protein [Nannocystis sp.]|uniref:peptidoglycan-binding domain-containing protein n=1 Tax=Nannocystis sp. TaxID=1962667 RepID=UPI00344F3ED4|nr:peptidoglycan-binding protein [Nannocystis sp.]
MSSGAEQTRWLQGCLRQLVDPGLVVDGIPGGRTTAALKRFQQEHGLQADGIAGPRTIAREGRGAGGPGAPGRAPAPGPPGGGGGGGCRSRPRARRRRGAPGMSSAASR